MEIKSYRVAHDLSMICPLHIIDNDWKKSYSSSVMLKGAVEHPMDVVTLRTGLRVDVIPAWEGRREAVRPRRGSGNRRLYTDDDIRRLGLIRRTVEAGRQIGQVARLSNADLREYLSASRLRPPRLPESVR
jgi:hypothetical protein